MTPHHVPNPVSVPNFAELQSHHPTSQYPPSGSQPYLSRMLVLQTFQTWTWATCFAKYSNRSSTLAVPYPISEARTRHRACVRRKMLRVGRAGHDRGSAYGTQDMA
eukprot:1543613-Rhodomonas_salina.2